MAKSKEAGPIPHNIKRSVCPVSREQFAALAKPIDLGVLLSGRLAMVQSQPDGSIGFSTGSLGWRLNEKLVILVGEVPVTVQVQGNLIIVGSKDLPK